jgi:hypothetical protein
VKMPLFYHWLPLIFLLHYVGELLLLEGLPFGHFCLYKAIILWPPFCSLQFSPRTNLTNSSGTKLAHWQYLPGGRPMEIGPSPERPPLPPWTNGPGGVASHLFTPLCGRITFAWRLTFWALLLIQGNHSLASLIHWLSFATKILLPLFWFPSGLFISYWLSEGAHNSPPQNQPRNSPLHLTPYSTVLQPPNPPPPSVPSNSPLGPISLIPPVYRSPLIFLFHFVGELLLLECLPFGHFCLYKAIILWLPSFID